MKFIKKYSDFTITYEEIENVGSVVFATMLDGTVWHKVANDMTREYKHNKLTKDIQPIPLFVVVENNYVVSITNDATMLAPYERSEIYHYEMIEGKDKFNLHTTDFVKFNEKTSLLEKLEIPEGILNPTLIGGQIVEGATDLEKVQAQISEYSELDTPSTLKEMGTELANECMNMLIELRNMAYTLGNPATIEDRDLLVLPKPSKELEAFKNKFKKFF